ncbi:hypothetical protein QQS21_006361 [Conoideocrella luteorostrata]|uniref:NAD dependent epimerase/dehydratase n=1 Tax=Conoideocrella luteorostrata TaxID=1105319 RepID=A0AAJ0CN37_9HYPO|nr:hypothetical protein QQS21_006361 [Conoideocrella luteorostrata]
MGQEYSVPKPGSKIQVIGAGLPRTGTASFSRALEILLSGPVYHGGTQITIGPEYEIKTWMQIASQWPFRDDTTEKHNMNLIAGRLDGFVASNDYPVLAYIPQLVKLYPDAKIICTTRDVDSWAKSMDAVAKAASQWYLRILLLPLPSLRYFPSYCNDMAKVWYTLYGKDEPTENTYHRHMEWLRDVVPKERLVFVSVQDGWEPLCKALDLPVPDIPFPRINDSKAIDNFAARQVKRALLRWALMVGSAVGVAFGIRWLMS